MNWVILVRMLEYLFLHKDRPVERRELIKSLNLPGKEADMVLRTLVARQLVRETRDGEKIMYLYVAPQFRVCR